MSSCLFSLFPSFPPLIGHRVCLVLSPWSFPILHGAVCYSLCSTFPLSPQSVMSQTCDSNMLLHVSATSWTLRGSRFTLTVSCHVLSAFASSLSRFVPAVFPSCFPFPRHSLVYLGPVFPLCLWFCCILTMLCVSSLVYCIVVFWTPHPYSQFHHLSSKNRNQHRHNLWDSSPVWCEGNSAAHFILWIIG